MPDPLEFEHEFCEDEAALVIKPNGFGHYRCLTCHQPTSPEYPQPLVGDWLR